MQGGRQLQSHLNEKKKTNGSEEQQRKVYRKFASQDNFEFN